MNIVEYRKYQIINSETILQNIAKYAMLKKNSKVDMIIDDDISCFTTTKGYNEGKRVCFTRGERSTNIFVPMPNITNDFYTYKMIPRIVQSSLVDDIFYFHPSYVKCDVAKFYYKKDRTSVANLVKNYKNLWVISANYNVLFTPHIFTVDESKLNEMNEFMDIILTEYEIFDLDGTINKRKRKLKCFVSKAFLEEVKSCNNDECLLVPDIAFAKTLLEQQHDTFTIQLSDISFEQYVLSKTIFSHSDSYLNIIVEDEFKKSYTKSISLAVAFFLYLYCICTRKDANFDKYSRLIYGKSSSLKYRYIQAYQQVFIPFERSVTNVLRKISKSKKVKDDEITNLATEVSRLSTISWNDIYNPYTEMRLRTSMTLPFKDLSDEMRELDKSMYGIICPIDTGDKDPGKVVRATENMDVDKVGRTQSSFRYSNKLMSLFFDNSVAFGHPFLDIYLKDKTDAIGSLVVTLVDKIDLKEINEYDSSISYLNETKIISEKVDELVFEDEDVETTDSDEPLESVAILEE